MVLFPESIKLAVADTPDRQCFGTFVQPSRVIPSVKMLHCVRLWAWWASLAQFMWCTTCRLKLWVGARVPSGNYLCWERPVISKTQEHRYWKSEGSRKQRVQKLMQHLFQKVLWLSWYKTSLSSELSWHCCMLCCLLWWNTRGHDQLWNAPCVRMAVAVQMRECNQFMHVQLRPSHSLCSMLVMWYVIVSNRFDTFSGRNLFSLVCCQRLCWYL